MTLTLRPVEKSHLSALFRLKPHEDQAGLVAPNEITLAQAAYEGDGVYVWGLWAEQTLIGLMAMIHPGEYTDLSEGDDREAAYVWRLMIGSEHQGHGYGRAALDEAIRQAADWGLPRVALSVVDSPKNALGFYERAGFRKTGRIVEEEIEMMREV